MHPRSLHPTALYMCLPFPALIRAPTVLITAVFFLPSITFCDMPSTLALALARAQKASILQPFELDSLCRGSARKWEHEEWRLGRQLRDPFPNALAHL